MIHYRREIEDGTDAALEIEPIIARLKRASCCFDGLILSDEATIRAIDEKLDILYYATDALLGIAEDCLAAEETSGVIGGSDGLC